VELTFQQGHLLPKEIAQRIVRDAIDLPVVTERGFTPPLALMHLIELLADPTSRLPNARLFLLLDAPNDCLEQTRHIRDLAVVSPGA
jgi:hypothetical protein